MSKGPRDEGSKTADLQLTAKPVSVITKDPVPIRANPCVLQWAKNKSWRKLTRIGRSEHLQFKDHPSYRDGTFETLFRLGQLRVR